VILAVSRVDDCAIRIGDEDNFWVFFLELSQAPTDESTFHSVPVDSGFSCFPVYSLNLGYWQRICQPDTVQFVHIFGSRPRLRHLFVSLTDDAAPDRPAHEFSNGENPKELPVSVFYTPRPRNGTLAVKVVVFDDKCSCTVFIDFKEMERWAWI
jgi:hypothetical protein